MKWGIIGFGSIGKRHSKNIIAMDDEVFVVTKRIDCPHPVYQNIEDLLLAVNLDFIIICNETSLHADSYVQIRALNRQIVILIEKPIFDKKYDFKDDPNTFVAYCLRFNPLVQRLKELLGTQKCLSALFYAGQYLPNWRPDRDYKTTYSSHKTLGGGVVRDLSHELDLAVFLLGNLSLRYSDSSKVSSLEIESEDLFSGHFLTKSCSSISIELNYLDRISQRFCILITDAETYRLDFITKTITSSRNTESFTFDPNEMYQSMLRNLKEKKIYSLTSFEDGQKIMDLIHHIELPKEAK